MFITAAHQTFAAEVVAMSRHQRAASARRRVAAIDEMLDVLEHMHLNRERTIDRLVRTRLRRLELEVGLPLPRRVVRARNTVRLHAALLDWQDVVLDEVVPGRRLLLDLDEALEAEDLTSEEHADLEADTDADTDLDTDAPLPLRRTA